MADTNGHIFVVPGNHIPAVPDYRFKAGAEYAVTQDWKVGADLNAVGSQYLVGDQANQNAKVPAYWVVNLNTSYQVTKNVEVFGLIRNLFNQHYYSAGTFFEPARSHSSISPIHARSFPACRSPPMAEFARGSSRGADELHATCGPATVELSDDRPGML